MSALEAKGNDIYRFIVCPLGPEDPRSAGLLKDAHSLGLSTVAQVACQDLYFIQGALSSSELEQLAARLLHDPVTQSIRWDTPALTDPSDGGMKSAHTIEVALRPGVTDPVAEQIVRAAHLLGVSGVQAASTGQRFIVQGDGLQADDLHRLANRLLCNPVIQRYALGEIAPAFPEAAAHTGQVEALRLRGLSDEQLFNISLERRAALDLAEMQAIRSYCKAEGRDLTDVEFEMLAQTWSEHCVHKTFKARIEVEAGFLGTSVIDNLFNHTIRAATAEINAPWVRSAFTDNAGIIEFDGANEVSFKVETHNHPSAIEPFGGANTGIGGVIRDVIGVSARPIAATDVLCFGPQDLDFASLPAGVLHPRRIASGVVAGIQDYGNKIGIPTVNGAILYDPGYISNPLVFCGCAGIAPAGAHPREALPGDHILVIGGRTGRDGLRGATFSSMTMDAQTGEVAGASVQIGAPIVEKGLIDVVLAARQQGLYHAITDCGAGGLSSAVGEMASRTGGLVQLERVPLKYPGLAPWEVWLSEAQERQVLAVPLENLAAFREICEIYEVEQTDIGEFTTSGRLVVRYHEQVVLDLDNSFLHHGIPQRRLRAILPVPGVRAGQAKGEAALPAGLTFEEALLALLACPDIASKEGVIRVYDHEVQGGTVVRPLVGIHHDGPSDACVIKPAEGRGAQALVLSAGISPEFGKLDPYQMALNVIDEALRNAVAVGADPGCTAILDNFCWGDPLNPHTLGGLVAAALGCRDGAMAYGTPFISGKDSFNNEYLGADGQRHAIPPTLLISAIGVMDRWSDAATMDLKEPGNALYLAGPFAPTLGGSHLDLVAGRPSGDGVPACDMAAAAAGYRAFNAALRAGLVRASHDLSEGGLAAAAAEMCIAGRLGLDLALPEGDPVRAVFGETTGCLLVEVRPADRTAFEAHFTGLALHPLGAVTAEPRLRLRSGAMVVVDLPVADLVAAWRPDLP